MADRKLASVRIIKDIQPIEGADAIEVATVDGWKVVVKKDEFEINDPCVYFEVDSFLPIKEEFEFLRKSSYRDVEGLGEGFRLRTIKLRGQVSQGLIIPIEQAGLIEYYVGMDVTEYLGVKKYEPPIPAQLAGQVRGSFPSFIPKTDQERIQNCYDTIDQGMFYEETMKLDGTSCTIFKYEGELRVCSRNLELKVNEENANNSLVKMALDIENRLQNVDNVAFQGELMGPGIQKNREGFSEHRFFVFDVYDIKQSRYLAPWERRELVERLGLEHVPVLNNAARPSSYDEMMEKVTSLKSMVHPIAEGTVWKANSHTLGMQSFKIISNRFLLKEED